MTRQTDIHAQVVDVMSDYLGPAAGRFVDRHIHNHLNKRPEELSVSDLATLIDWLRISIAFLTEERQVIDNIIYRLTLIADKQATRK